MSGQDVIRPGQRVAVVGGGALGLRLAWHLAGAGAAVTVFEAAPELGGLASSWSIDTADGPIAWDRYYHVILESDRALRSLLADVDLDTELRWTTTQTGYWSGGRLSPASTPRDLLALPGLSLVAKARLAATLARGASVRDGRALEDVPVEAWLMRWSGRATFERFWVPLLEAKLGNAWRETNAAFIWATIRRLTAARRAGIGGERFGAVPGGAGRILEDLGTALATRGAVVRRGTRVEQVTATDDGRVELHAAGERWCVDHAVLTTTPRLAAEALPGLAVAVADRWRAFRYQGVVCVSAVLRRPLAPYYLTYLMDDLPFTALVEMTTLIPPAWLGGHTLVYLPRYVAADDACFTRSDDDLVAEFLGGLQRVHPIAAADVVGARVARAREVFPLPVLRYSEHVPPLATGVPGVSLVSSAQIVNGTLNLNETVGLADASAAALLGGPVGSGR
jgi:protoporphyrinogen oxidase